MKTITWTRWAPGWYTAGNFVIRRTAETRHGAVWALTIEGTPYRRTKPTLHELQAIAGSIAAETPLFTLARLDPIDPPCASTTSLTNSSTT